MDTSLYDILKTLISQGSLRIATDLSNENLTCIICGNLLVDSYQTQCGCQYCRECIVQYLTEGVKNCRGANMKCKNEILVLDKNVIKSSFLDEKILKLRVYCPNKRCTRILEVSQINDHLTMCTLKSIECPSMSLFGEISEPSLQNFITEGFDDREYFDNLLRDLKKEFEILKADLEMSKLEISNLVGELRKKETLQRDAVPVNFAVMKEQLEKMVLEKVKQNGDVSYKGTCSITEIENVRIKMSDQINEQKVEFNERVREIIGERNFIIEKLEYQKKEMTGQMGDQKREMTENIVNEMLDIKQQMEYQKTEMRQQMKDEIKDILKQIEDQNLKKKEQMNYEMGEVIKRIEEQTREMKEAMTHQTEELKTLIENQKQEIELLNAALNSKELIIGDIMRTMETQKTEILYSTQFAKFADESVERLKKECASYQNETQSRLTLMEEETAKKESAEAVSRSMNIVRVDIDKLSRTIEEVNVGTNRKVAIGLFTFTVDRFSARRNAKEVMLSPYFYSHSNGYKLRLQVHPGGHLDGSGKHLSIFILFGKGEYDDMLPWPCMQTVHLSISNQVNRRSRYAMPEGSINYQYAFDKSVTNDNMEYGYSTFISHVDLLASPGLLVEDSVVIICEISAPR